MATRSSDETHQGILDAFLKLTETDNGISNGNSSDEPFRGDYNGDSDDSDACGRDAATDGTAEERQGQLCHTLLRQLQRRQQQQQQPYAAAAGSGGDSTADTDTAADCDSLRSVFPDCRVADLLPVLADLLQDRVDVRHLMPATQDEEANEAVLSDGSSTRSALSLTVPAMHAARLYAHLLCQPGAIGSGLIDLEALTALTALVRRWTTECIGREGDVVAAVVGSGVVAPPRGSSSSSSSSNSSARPNSSLMASSPTHSPPKKRCRGSRTRRAATIDNDEADDDESRWEVDSGGQSDPSLQSTLALGCLVAMEICKIPQQAEFASWSSEAREGLVEGVLAAMGTAAALFGEGGAAAAAAASSGTASADTSTIGDEILQHGRRSLEACIVNTEKGQHHDSAIVILRGMLHLLQVKVALPNGERGKMDAHIAARHVLASLMERNLDVVTGRTSSENDASDDHLQTPNRDRSSRRSSISGTNKNTPKSSMRHRRLSLDGGQTPMTSPALKRNRGRFVPPTASESAADSNIIQERPRGVSALFLSLLQKLATGKAGLEKAALRRSTVQTLSFCLKWMPHVERTHFLRFLLKLCHSKVSVHRLVACELIGAVFTQPWLNDHRNDVVGGGQQSRTVEDDDESVRSADGGTTMAAAHQTPSSPANSTRPGLRASSASSGILPSAMMQALQGRLVDRTAAVRASALASLHSAVSAAAAAVDAHSENSNSEERSKVGFVDMDGDDADENLDDLLLALRRRAIKDEAAAVRKTAISTLTMLLIVRRAKISEFYISPICELCQDPSLLVRKAAAESLTTLVEECSVSAIDDVSNGCVDGVDSGLLAMAWAACVLPMVMDDETSSKATDAFLSVVVSPLLTDPDSSAMEKERVAWQIVAHVGCSSGQHGASKGAAHALKMAVSRLGRDDHDLVYVELLNRVAKVAFQTLEDNNKTSETMMVGSWCLLESLLWCRGDAVAARRNSVESNTDLDFCATAYETILQMHTVEPKRSVWLMSTLRSSLVILSKVASGLTSRQAVISSTKLQADLAQFRIPPDAVSAAIGALVELTVSQDTKTSREGCTVWIESLFLHCENEIAGYLQEAGKISSGHGREHLTSLVRALFTAGDLAMVGFRLDDDEKFPKDRDMSEDPLHGLHVHPSKRLLELIQITVSDWMPGSSNVKTPHLVRAHGFTVLGKLCLRDEKLARSSLNLLARELHPGVFNTTPSVQSNALLVMGDLCVRYTNMTDRYLPIMAVCLQSGTTESNVSILNSCSASFATVRKHAVLLLSSLLLQDYIKWRGLLFHRFLVTCSDEDEEVATLAETALSGPLWQRNPKIFFNHFVESIFVLNNCKAHPIYISATRQGDGGSGVAVGFDGIALDGEAGQARRRRMYDFLLSKLSDEEKIGVTARLAKEVFGAAVDDDGDLSLVCQGPPVHKDREMERHLSGAWNVLTDTFYVLTHKSIKVGNKSPDESMDTSIEDPSQLPNPSRQLTVAKGRLLSKISRKHLIEIVLPILCNLKAKLQASCSPLLKDLMAYLLDIFGNFKLEVKEFLANDPALLQEIEFDARHHSN